ncbi:MAG: cysteine desulfurase family protein [Oscillospiraceae bacterium]
MIYFDNAATTKPCGEAVEAMINAAENFGNPSSLHKLGVTASQLISASRKTIAKTLGVTENEIYFTSGATEADNTAIFGAAASLGKRKKRIVTSSVEHPAVASACHHLEQNGFEIVRISPREDGFHAEDFVRSVDEKTCLVTCMLCNNETGALLPVGEIFKRVKKKFPDTLTHCDMVQGYLKLPYTASKLYADMISVSGHKVHAPKGVGALYIKKGVHIANMFYGGGQERGFRSGTESVPLITAFASAAAKLHSDLAKNYEYVSSLSDYLKTQIEKSEGMNFNSPESASPYVNSISVENLRSEVMLHFLETKEIYVSSGSACSKGKKSSVLSEFNIPDKLADSTLRISFCPENTKEEIDELICALKQAQTTLLGSK